MASGKESVVKVTNSEEKKKALDAAIAKLEKDFGKGAVMKLGESGAHVSVETVPTGCLSLDLALGLGGVPKGRVIEVYGPESSGKTTVALHMISEVQKRGGIAGFIDAEHALDPVYAKNIGVDIDELYISQSLGHQSCLQSYMAVSHISFNLLLWNKCRNRVNNDNINRTGTHHRLRNLKCLISAVRLRNI